MFSINFKSKIRSGNVQLNTLSVQLPITSANVDRFSKFVNLELSSDCVMNWKFFTVEQHMVWEGNLTITGGLGSREQANF